MRRDSHLDLVAMVFTGTSTVMLAMQNRGGFVFLMCGSLLWTAVALMARLHGRRVWGQVVASVWTCGWAIYGLLSW